MSEFAGCDLDRSTARAWSRFQSRLADHVAEMADDDVLVVEAESGQDEDELAGAAPYVQFCAWGEELVRCEVSSNEFLSPEHLIEEAGESLLIGLGWTAPTYAGGEEPDSGSMNFFLDLERNHADQLAVMTVRAFRDVFGVEHPAFLSSDRLSPETDDTEPNPAAAASASDAAEVAEALAVLPTDREHLQRLVDEALVPVFDDTPEHDEDDDIPVVAGTALVWVRVLEQSPTVQLFSVLVSGVADRERAAFEVSVLNRDVPFVKFLLAEDRVLATLYLSAYPFAPLQLRAALAMMSDVVDRVDDDLAARVGGRRALEPAEEGDPLADEEDEPLNPAMLTLLQLEAESPGSLDPELVAKVCEMDRDLILELITWNSGQEISWRQSRDEALLAGDPDEEAEACEQEMRHAEQTTNLLRRALRVVVEATSERRSGYALPPALRRQRRTRGERPLPGLEDPEQGLWEE